MFKIVRYKYDFEIRKNLSLNWKCVEKKKMELWMLCDFLKINLLV